MNNRSLLAVLVVSSLVGFVGRVEAQTCTTPMVWAPGLNPFCADTPARADEMNQNFSALVNHVQQKVGTLGSPALTVTGAASMQGGLTVTGTTTVTGPTTVNGATTVNGPLQARSLRTSVTTIAPISPATWTSPIFAATDLTATFDVPAGGATVELSYTMANDTTAPCFLVTRLMLGSTTSAPSEVIEARAISGQVQYPNVYGRMIRVLGAGTYTATVEYRTNGTVISSPAAVSFTQRSLVVHVLGNN